ncbi:MAG: ribonuclease III [Gammaproteobacteria bacterium]|nr:MAG: ribonuclease III [Gammaproteobacteria bacterium]
MTYPLADLAKKLGYQFADLNILQQALTHRSVGSRNNERLEFLGDAMLGFVIADELYARYPQAREGELSRLRSSLVRRETLAELARELQISHYLRLGPGERKSGGHQRDSIAANALEALFGAIYLDGGFTSCRQCILSLFAEKLGEVPHPDRLKDPKTRLQEYLQARQLALPEYVVLEVSGTAHAQTFRVNCTVNAAEKLVTEGKARSRRHAEQEAAMKMLELLNGG